MHSPLTRISTSHFAKAYVLMGQNRTQEAVIEGERGLALNPSFIDAYVALCAANNFLGRPDRALELADKAIRLVRATRSCASYII